ncbi:hypothetical protein BH10PAT1_BH10PAT1_3490 [soil metagenome]
MIKERELITSEINEKVTSIRRQFEEHVIDNDVLMQLYHDYNPEVEDIKLFVESAKELFPSLNCGLASLYLRECLHTGRIINGKYNDENHTFLLIEDVSEEPILVDITSDQYGGPDVYIGPVVAPWKIKTSFEEQYHLKQVNLTSY